MTNIEKIRKAVNLLRYECIKHKRCSDCPLNKVTCHTGKGSPATWEPDKVGVENDD